MIKSNPYSACQQPLTPPQPPEKYGEPRAANNWHLLRKHTDMLPFSLSQQGRPPFPYLSRLNLQALQGNSYEPQTKYSLYHTGQAGFMMLSKHTQTQPWTQITPGKQACNITTLILKKVLQKPSLISNTKSSSNRQPNRFRF